jgi:preprotein translocase subunit SecG
MEDWAFAGSWDNKHVVQCTPTTYGGYKSVQTIYNNSTLRAFNMLVETSDPKTPNRNDLGMRTSPLVSSNGSENGHIARNIRLALLAMDIVEPYVTIRGLEGLELEDDVLPTVNMRRYNGVSYLENSKLLWIPCENNNDTDDGTRKVNTEYSCQGSVKVSWTVGGAFTVDDTKLVVGLWDDLPSNLADGTDGSYPSKKTLNVLNNRNKFVVSLPSNTMGRTRWHVDGPHPTKSTSSSSNIDDTFGINPTFEAMIDTSKYLPGSTIVVFAKAKVDKDWLDQANNVAPAGLGPTSHIVNSRRNSSYLAMNAGKVIRGKVDDWWYSDPIAIIIGSDDVDNEAEAQLLQDAVSNDAPRTMDGDRIKAVHINSRFVNTTGTFAGKAKVASGNDGAIDTASGGAAEEVVTTLTKTGTISVITTNLYVLGLFFVLIVVALALLVRRRRQRRYIEQVIAEYEDDIEVSASYRDRPIEDVDARRII